MKVAIVLNSIDAQVDPDDITRAIQNAVADGINWQIKDEVQKELGVWVKEELQKQKEKLMEELRPQIENHVNSFRPPRY